VRRKVDDPRITTVGLALVMHAELSDAHLQEDGTHIACCIGGPRPPQECTWSTPVDLADRWGWVTAKGEHLRHQCLAILADLGIEVEG
jgi:hypothetical protein